MMDRKAQLRALAEARKRPPFKRIATLPPDLIRDLLAFYRANANRNILAEALANRSNRNLETGNAACLSEHYAQVELQKLRTGGDPKGLPAWNRYKGQVERNTRLFPVDLTTRPGEGLWVKLTNWQADANGQVDQGSTRRGRLAKDGRVEEFFDAVAGRRL